MVLMASACGSPEDREYRLRARSLDRADVAAELRDAVRNKDLRFVAVNSLTLAVPGVARERQWRPHEVRLIEGTSDGRESAAHGEFCTAAARYAERYNKALLRLLPPEEAARRPPP